MSARVGHVYCDSTSYVDAQTGQLMPKYFLVLAAPYRHDVVFRFLTSRYEGMRPEDPPCFHGDPYAGFFLGVLGGELGRKSWLDLRGGDDFDHWDFRRYEAEQRIRTILALPLVLLRSALECAAAAEDTTRQQERLIRDSIALLADQRAP